MPSVHLLGSYVSGQTTGPPVQRLRLSEEARRVPVPQTKFNPATFITQHKQFLFQTKLSFQFYKEIF